MSKEYVCDCCKNIITSPHKVKMKEFYIGCTFEVDGVYPSLDKRKMKIHLCDKCFFGLREVSKKSAQQEPAKDSNVLTNGDRIRAMSDEELAEHFNNLAVICDCCADNESCIEPFDDPKCIRGVLKWLKQPAEAE